VCGPPAVPVGILKSHFPDEPATVDGRSTSQLAVMVTFSPGDAHPQTFTTDCCCKTIPDARSEGNLTLANDGIDATSRQHKKSVLSLFIIHGIYNNIKKKGYSSRNLKTPYLWLFITELLRLSQQTDYHEITFFFNLFFPDDILPFLLRKQRAGGYAFGKRIGIQRGGNQ